MVTLERALEIKKFWKEKYLSEDKLGRLSPNDVHKEPPFLESVHNDNGILFVVTMISFSDVNATP